MTFKELILQEMSQPYFKQLEQFLEYESAHHIIYPPSSDVMNAFRYTPLDTIKVVIVGQDPYHQPGQAMGLSFSVNPKMPLPKSLINIYSELENDLGICNTSGSLVHWAKQGVFLLNTTLTVQASKPMSHQNKGWEIFTSRMIEAICQYQHNVVFILWGKHASQFKDIALKYHHHVISSAHPSPLSAYRGFLGSKPFSKTNAYLISTNQNPIDWRTF